MNKTLVWDLFGFGEGRMQGAIIIYNAGIKQQMGSNRLNAEHGGSRHESLLGLFYLV